MVEEKSLFERRVDSLVRILPKWLKEDPESLHRFLLFLGIPLNLTEEDLPNEDTLVKAIKKYKQENKIDDETTDVQSVLEEFYKRESTQNSCNINPINFYKNQFIKNNINVIKVFVSSLKKKLVKNMNPKSHPLLFLSQLPVQIALRRVVELLIGMKDGMSHGLMLPTALCARSVLETCADLSAFHKKFKEVLEKKEFDKVVKVVDIHIRKTRDSSKSGNNKNLVSTNIKTHITDFDKIYCKGTDQSYDELSWICHPNYEGNFDLYAKLYEKETVHFDVEDKRLDVLIKMSMSVKDPLKRFGEIINKIGDLATGHESHYVQHFLKQSHPDLSSQPKLKALKMGQRET